MCQPLKIHSNRKILLSGWSQFKSWLIFTHCQSKSANINPKKTSFQIFKKKLTKLDCMYLTKKKPQLAIEQKDL